MESYHILVSTKTVRMLNQLYLFSHLMKIREILRILVKRIVPVIVKGSLIEEIKNVYTHNLLILPKLPAFKQVKDKLGLGR